MLEIKLGVVYRDTITGCEGVAVSKTEFLFGCHRVCIQPRELKDGKPVESQYFDAQQLAESYPGQPSVVPVAAVVNDSGGSGECAPRPQAANAPRVPER